MDEDDILEDDGQDLFINFPEEVQQAIEQVLPSTDPLDQPDFNTVDYINSLFPTEQSLSNIDDVVSKMELKIRSIDDEISTVVRGQTLSSGDGRQALEEAQRTIGQLFVHIRDIKAKAERSERMVREITRDIKQLDCAKRNLTAAITALNHLHMLVGGVDSLRALTEKRQYAEILLPLQAITEVMQHFQDYSDIPQISALQQQVQRIHADLAEQITRDFQQAFSMGSGPGAVTGTGAIGNPAPMAPAPPGKQLADACHVVGVLAPRVKRDLLRWFVGQQLQEYRHLFQDSEDTAWLDRVDRRYAWLKRHLLEFEERLGILFPPHWEVSERIAVHFCNVTREDLSRLMSKRRSEMDVKLLLYAIGKTSAFESLLSRRFTGVTLEETDSHTQSPPAIGPPPAAETTPTSAEEAIRNAGPFDGLIGRCFVPYLNIYIDSVDRNLADMIERFILDERQNLTTETAETQATVLPSCADLFLFYKKSMVQCSQLSTGKPMLDLAHTFQKYLREYALRLLQAGLPKHSDTGSSVSSITRDLQKISTSGLLPTFGNLLRDEETVKFTKDEQKKICCILTTAEYCLETTQQLEKKLKEKVEAAFADQINLAHEQDIFHNVISNCIQILVQDLETACEPALTAMTKMQWSSVESVGDESPYVTSITSQLKQTVPVVRDNLSQSRKYFTQFCVKFASSFIPKFIQAVYKCRPLQSTVGAEQLLLDAHSLKTALLELPSIGSQVARKAPASYTRVVVKDMTKAEMILKVVMSATEPKAFAEQYAKLLPDCQLPEFHKVLEMKGLKRAEQAAYVEAFRQQRGSIGGVDSGASSGGSGASSARLYPDSLASPEHEAGRIRKLEKLIKKRLPN